MIASTAHSDPRRRPWLIWVVSGYWILAAPYMLWFYSGVLTGRRTIPVLDRGGVVVLLGIFTAALAGAIALVLLKRVAVVLFMLAMAAIIGLDVFLLLTTHWLQVLGPTGIANVVISLMLYTGTTAYAWSLLRRGALR